MLASNLTLLIMSHKESLYFRTKLFFKATVMYTLMFRSNDSQSIDFFGQLAFGQLIFGELIVFKIHYHKAQSMVTVLQISSEYNSFHTYLLLPTLV